MTKQAEYNAAFDEGFEIGKAQCETHHDEIKQSERKKVLELLKCLRKYAYGEYKEAELSDNEHDLRIHHEYESRIWEIMIELQQSNDGEP